MFLAEQESVAIEIVGTGNSFFREVRFLDHTHFLMRPIGAFYGQFSKRLLIYLLQTVCLLAGVFLTLILANDPDYVTRQLPLVCTLALHLALVFSVCHVSVDVFANHLWPGLMAYYKRKVGLQLLVFFVGLIAGYYLHQATLPELLSKYATWPASPWGDLAQTGRHNLSTNLSLVPLYCSALYVHYLLGIIYQYSSESADKSPGPEVYQSYLDKMQIIEKQNTAESKTDPADELRPLVFREQGLEVLIFPETITHISAEDHYCRIYFFNGASAHELMVRKSLKQLVSLLPVDVFERIHRSHLVNIRKVTGMKKRGQNHWITVGPSGACLPISRRRFRALRPAMQGSNLVFR